MRVYASREGAAAASRRRRSRAGATVENSSTLHCDVEGVHALLGRAQKLCPGLGAWQLDDAWAGLRPTTTDGAPVRISASRRLQYDSYHVVGRFFVEFEAVRTASSDRDAPRMAWSPRRRLHETARPRRRRRGPTRVSVVLGTPSPRLAQVEIRKKEDVEEEKVKVVKDIERGIKAQEEVQERIKYAASIRAERRQKIIDHRKEKEKYYGVVRSPRFEG